jgi:hypothetical protein
MGNVEPMFPDIGDVWYETAARTTWIRVQPDDAKEPDQWVDVETRKPREGQLSFGSGKHNRRVKRYIWKRAFTKTPSGKIPIPTPEELDLLRGLMNTELRVDSQFRVGPLTCQFEEPDKDKNGYIMVLTVPGIGLPPFMDFDKV